MGDKEKDSATYDEQSVINAIRQAYKLVEGINSQVVEKAVVFCNRAVSFMDTARVYALSESNNSRNRAGGLRESDILLSPESFGVCILDAGKCIPEVEDQKWQECDQIQKINGEACVTMDSYMICLKGGIITLIEDGQRIDELMKLHFPEYVTVEQLRALMWHGADEKMTFELNRVLEKYDITTVERIRHFLAQCIKESNRGMYTREGEYTNWKSQEEYEEEYDRKYKYGYKYRGAGYIQMTWDYSYLAFATFLIQQECKDDNVIIEWKSPRDNADGFQDRYDEAVKTAENIGKDIEK